jgi:sugar transferase (PEP-CTERM/EpsH1 system associated)
VSQELLFLCHRIPFPPDKGDKIRSHALLAHFAARQRVHVACFIDDPADWRHVKSVQNLAGGECIFVKLRPMLARAASLDALLTGRPLTTSYFRSMAIDRWLTRLVAAGRVDQAVVFGSAMAPYILGRRDIDPARALFDMVDLDSDKWRQYGATGPWPKRWLYRREARTLLRLEREAARRFGATVLISPHEVASFGAEAPESASRLHSISNGVDPARFSPKRQQPNVFPAGVVPIVMTGAMDYRPNIEGARWFVDAILPRLLPLLPAAHFFVVGANPPPALKALAGPHVTVTGRVPDVQPYLAHAAAVVAPLQIARGLQNKVIEGMAMARPVVATWEAARALAAIPGEDLWVETEPDRFAAAVLAAATGPDRDRIARNGRLYVERHHDWSRNLSVMDALLHEIGQSAEARGIIQQPDTMAAVSG